MWCLSFSQFCWPYELLEDYEGKFHDGFISVLLSIFHFSLNDCVFFRKDGIRFSFWNLIVFLLIWISLSFTFSFVIHFFYTSLFSILSCRPFSSWAIKGTYHLQPSTNTRKEIRSNMICFILILLSLFKRLLSNTKWTKENIEHFLCVYFTGDGANLLSRFA